MLSNLIIEYDIHKQDNMTEKAFTFNIFAHNVPYLSMLVRLTFKFPESQFMLANKLI